MSDQWYYGSDGQQRGPVGGDEIRARLASGAMAGNDLVWREGMLEWAPAAGVPEFAGAVPIVAGVLPIAQATQAGEAGLNPYDSAHRALGYFAAMPEGFEYVGFWWRVLATLIDGIITGVAGAIIGGVLGGIIGISMGTGNDAMIAIQIVSQVAGVILNWLYTSLLESSAHQATIGKLAIGVRVTDFNGDRLTFARATGRFFAKYVSAITLCIGFAMVGWTQRKQGLHDIIAGTLVLRGRSNTVIRA